MPDAARLFYDSIKTYEDLEQLVEDEETESRLVECKPARTKFNPEMQAKIARVLSAFRNAEGGVVIWGMGTDNRSHGGVDVMTQVEPGGHIEKFMANVEAKLPLLTNPPTTDFEQKIILKEEADAKGVLLTYVPVSLGPPVRSAKDNGFWLRCGGECHPLPYAMIQQKFAATDVPDLRVVFPDHLSKNVGGTVWDVVLSFGNESLAAAEHVVATVDFLNHEEFRIGSDGSAEDKSHLSASAKHYVRSFDGVVHYGTHRTISIFRIHAPSAKAELKLMVRAYASRMRPRLWRVTVGLLPDQVQFTCGDMEYIG